MANSLPKIQTKAEVETCFFPTLACQADEFYHLPIHVWIYRPNESRVSSLALKVFRRALARSGPVDNDLIFERTKLFVAIGVSRQSIAVNIGPRKFLLGKSRINGHLKKTLHLTEAELKEMIGVNNIPPHSWVKYSSQMDSGELLEGEVLLLSKQGVSIITDIDDTIKYSNVQNKRQLLVNAFGKKYQALPGMPELFRAWEKQGAAFHYVSSTPWQLYSVLADFIKNHSFPRGSFHLKSFYWKDLSWFRLLASPKGTKPKVIEPILKAYPERKFVLVGDAIERDPEVYVRLARKYEGQILKVFIRVEASDIETREKVEKTLSKLPSWQVFSCGSEIETDLNKLVPTIAH